MKAREPVIFVETHEEERLVAIVNAIASDPNALKRPRRVVMYSLSKGLHQHGDPGHAVPPDVALAQLVKVTEPTLFVFFDLHHSLSTSGRGPDPVVVRAIRDVAEAFRSGPVPSTLICASPVLELPVDLEKTVTVLDFPFPGSDEVSAVLQAIVDANADHIDVDLDGHDRERLIHAALGLTRNEAENAFARAIAANGKLDASDVELVLEEKRQTVRKSGLLEFVRPEIHLDDVGGLQNLKRWLLKRDRAWTDEAQDWSLPFPRGILITGVPGCGKSLTAKCTSSLWGMPLLRMDVGRVFSGLVGSSEQNMRAALRLAEAIAPSILWIDEIEKGFGSSGGDSSGTTQRVFGTFLTWMQEKDVPVFVVATANAIERLPSEFLRKGRFDEIFFVDLPTEAERQPIWEVHLRRRIRAHTPAGSLLTVDTGLLARLAAASEGYSGAEIEQCVINACFDAFADRRPVDEEDLLRAVANTVPLSVTQAEQIALIRSWAADRAVAATAGEDRSNYDLKPPPDGEAVTDWRGGRRIDF